jgi:hypothetical protein
LAIGGYVAGSLVRLSAWWQSGEHDHNDQFRLSAGSSLAENGLESGTCCLVSDSKCRRGRSQRLAGDEAQGKAAFRWRQTKPLLETCHVKFCHRLASFCISQFHGFLHCTLTVVLLKMVIALPTWRGPVTFKTARMDACRSPAAATAPRHRGRPDTCR